MESNLPKPANKNEKCFHCGQKITNTRIIFSKNGKVEGPYCSKKCSKNSTLKNEFQNPFNNKQANSPSASKLLIGRIVFWGVISALPLIITATIIYLLNKKKKR